MVINIVDLWNLDQIHIHWRVNEKSYSLEDVYVRIIVPRFEVDYLKTEWEIGWQKTAVE